MTKVIVDAENILSDFKIAKFEIFIQTIDILCLPKYKGSTFRGGFGNSFKKVVCVNRNKECNECMLKGKCVYAYIFETPVPENSDIMRKYRHCPHPFIIEPPENTKTVFNPGEEISFNLILIGKAINYLPYFIYTFEELGNIGIGKGRGKFELKTVRSRESEVKSQESGAKNEGKVIYSSDTKTLKSFASLALNISHTNFIDSGLLAIDFKTPTRIVYDTQLTLDLEFHILMRALLRRISLLSYFHCDKDMSDVDFKGIIEKAGKIKTSQRNLEWHDWERYSARQDTRMTLGGFKGEISFEGDVSNFMPFVLLGEQIHIGKGTSFGLGRYAVL